MVKLIILKIIYKNKELEYYNIKYIITLSHYSWLSF